MRESSFGIQIGGLRRDSKDPAGFSMLKNLAVGPGYLYIPAVPDIARDTGSQFFRGRTKTFRATATGIYEVTESTMAETLVSTVPTGGGGWWSFADFGPVYVFASGGRVISRRYTLDDDEYVYSTVSAAATNAKVVADYNDTRLFIGGTSKGTNTVSWSLIDGSDIWQMLDDTNATAQQAALLQRGTAVMPWRGEVRAMFQLGDGMAVYGADGITILAPTGKSFGMVDPKGLPRHIGIPCRSAVGGDRMRHVFVGTDGALYTLDESFQCERLGFEEYMPAAPVVVHDPIEAQWWISGTSTSYLLTAGGLSGPVSAVVTSAIRTVSGLVGSGVDYATAAVEAELWSGLLDAGDNAQKRMTFLRATCDGVTGMKGSIAYGTRSDGTLKTRPWAAASREKAMFINSVFTNARAGILFSGVPETARIYGLEARYQYHDRRAVRGTRGVTKQEE